MRIVTSVTVLIAVLSATSARSEELFSYFSQSDDPPRTSVTISPCTGDEVAECVSHSLSCAKAPGGEPELTIVVGDVEKIASSLIVGTKGQAKARLKLAGGSVSLAITSVRLDSNDMDGGWIATVGLGRIDDFYDVLTEKGSEGASLVVAGKHFPLAPQKGDGKKLVAWKDACIALEAQPLAEPSNTTAPMPKPASTPVASKPDCPFNSQRFRSPLYRDNNPDSYQELQFLDGASAGKVRLTEYHEGKPRWTAQGEFMCSNGFSICQIGFPLMLHGSVQLPYETVGNEQSGPELVVIPALKEEVYQQEWTGSLEGKSHRGLVAELLNGFAPTEDEVVAPYNVYRYTECAKLP